MISKTERWTAKCDKCGKAFTGGGVDYSASWEVSIVADMKTYGWRIKKRKCWCPDCKEGK